MSQTEPNHAAAATRDKASIYVVDDEPMLLELAVVILETLDYQIRTFRDPKDALESFLNARSRPVLLITDYAMHNMNGMELIAACRSFCPDQKILLLSGTVDESVFTGASIKPDRFLAKPYQAKQLVDVVRTLLPS